MTSYVQNFTLFPNDLLALWLYIPPEPTSRAVSGEIG